MAQHDYVIDNQSFPATRTDLNNVLQAIVSNNSGTSAPSTTFANQIWYDTATNTLFIRNEDNDANIPLLQFDQSADVAATLATVIDVLDAIGTNQAGTALTIRGGAGTGTGAGGSIILQTADGGSSGSSVNSHATRITVLDNGFVGIGTTSPDALLDVASNGVPLEIDSLNSNAFKLQFKDAGSAVAFLGASANTFFFGNSSATQLARIDSDGLKFGTDSAAANALDDYEEGTWTPTYIGSSSNPTVTFDIQVGIYRKVGGLVHAMFSMRTDAASGGSGSLFVSGLPFAGATTTNAFHSGSIGYSANFTTINPQAIHIGSNGTTIVLLGRITSGDANSDLRLNLNASSNLSNSSNSNFVIGQMTYPTDA